MEKYDPYRSGLYPPESQKLAHTIFGHTSDGWKYVTNSAMGTGVQDAVTKYYEGRIGIPTRVIAFPTSRGRSLTPPNTKQWTVDSL